MTREATWAQIVLARLALTLVIAFAMAGLLYHGMSGEVWNRIFASIAATSFGISTVYPSKT